MMLPLPFGRGVLTLGPALTAKRNVSVPIEAALDDALRRADQRP